VQKKETMTDNKLTVPKQSKGDVVHTLAKAGLSAIPVMGGPAAELFQCVIQPPLAKAARRMDGSSWGEVAGAGNQRS